MIITKLKVTLKGPLWGLDAFEIEGLDLINKWEEDTSKSEGSITVTNFNLSTDDLLDIFIKVSAPNGCTYTVVLSGTTKSPKKIISYTEEGLVVKKNGRLNIIITKDINEITQ
jgi:hypothetical protein